MNPGLAALRPYPMVELAQRKAALRAAGAEVFDFGTGDPVEPTWSAIREAARSAVPTISQYPTVAGPAPLRAAIAAYLARRFAVTCDPERAILPTAGSKEAIFHLPLAFLDPADGRDTVVYGTPAYPVYEQGTRFAHGRPYPVVLEAARGFRLELERLPGEVLERTRIAWFNYPHNPTGAGVDRAWLRAEHACCRAHGILMACDECYVDLWFEDAPAPPSVLEVAEQGVLALHSCSKRSGMTGYRSGFIAGDPELVATYRRWRAAMGVASPVMVTSAATVAWKDDDHVAERRAAFAAKREILAEGLLERGIEVLPSPAGLYLWARVPGDGDADAYASRCLEAGIVISPGGFFGPGGDGFFRLALVPTVDDCRRALARWPA